MILISIHALREESDTRFNSNLGKINRISIHALREESDLPSAGEAEPFFLFQSTLSARRATFCSSTNKHYSLPISIHALREESDCLGYALPKSQGNFNPRSPRGERLWLRLLSKQLKRFQSTLSARRATRKLMCLIKTILYFNPRSPRGERPRLVVLLRSSIIISIHALREESDASLLALIPDTDVISIHALREESDLRPNSRGLKKTISIHALREESDKSLFRGYLTIYQFQSTLSARRATKCLINYLTQFIVFQSTLSARRATR